MSVRRTWFFFALKDALPLGSEGWRLVFHQAECSSQAGDLNCLEEDQDCYAKVLHFVGIPFTDDSMSLSMQDILTTIDLLSEQDPASSDRTPPPPMDGMPGHRWVVAVSLALPEQEDWTFNDAFDVVTDAVIALRNATGSAVPDPAVERLHPMYIIAVQDSAGAPIVPLNFVLVEHTFPWHPAPASADQLKSAELLLVGRLNGHPAELYRTFATRARLATWQDGDYTKAVMSAAVACEILIKAAAWMLSLEGSCAEEDPCPSATAEGLFRLRPSQLIGQVLQPRLGGDWDSRHEGKPVREWRINVAQVRNRLLHLGHRMHGVDADGAAIAMRDLEAHVVDRLVAKADVYPRTAYALAGTEGLARRNKLEAVVRHLESVAPEGPEGWIRQYVVYVDDMVVDGD